LVAYLQSSSFTNVFKKLIFGFNTFTIGLNVKYEIGKQKWASLST
jgi:hypothetical protein